jgi:hypothetical protein
MVLRYLKSIWKHLIKRRHLKLDAYNNLKILTEGLELTRFCFKKQPANFFCRTYLFFQTLILDLEPLYNNILTEKSIAKKYRLEFSTYYVANRMISLVVNTYVF